MGQLAADSLAAIEERCDPRPIDELLDRLIGTSALTGSELDGALQEMQELASHGLTPSHLRRILSHLASAKGVSLLKIVAHASDAARQLGMVGAPLSFFEFRDHNMQITLQLQDGPPAANGFSIWMWLRWEGLSRSSSQAPAEQDHASGSPTNPAPLQAYAAESICELQVGKDYALQLLLVGGALTVRVLSSKGAVSGAQLSRPLTAGAWHFVSLSCAPPSRRWLAAWSQQSFHSIGNLVVHLDGKPAPSRQPSEHCSTTTDTCSRPRRRRVRRRVGVGGTVGIASTVRAGQSVHPR